MVTQRALDFHYELSETAADVTALAGLPLFFELAVVAGLGRALDEEVLVRAGQQGWTDREMVLSLALLNLAGGDCVDDLNRLELDAGLARVFRSVRTDRRSRRKRREEERRWRKGRTRAFPSPSSARRYLGRFHDPSQEALRQPGEAFIPAPTEGLRGLVRANAALGAFLQQHRPQRTATLDMDATLVETTKREALFSYKKFRAYQPLNTWWAEQGVVLHSEFRDGNVPAGYEQRRVLEQALTCLPEGIESVHLRSDTAGYQWDLLRYCEEGRNERFGRIEFVVGVDITDVFKHAIHTTPDLTWHDLGNSGQQWAEVSFVPNTLGATNKGQYRFIAIREPVRQLDLFEDEPTQLPFPTLVEEATESRPRFLFKLHGIVTNRMDTAAPELIQWYRDRCGKSEEAHSIMKRDLAGGQLPSKRFGANAAWWQIMLLAFNLVAVMKRLALDEDLWGTKRLKALRLWLIAVPARIVSHAGKLTLRLVGGARPYADLVLRVHERLLALASGPSG